MHTNIHAEIHVYTYMWMHMYAHTCACIHMHRHAHTYSPVGYRPQEGALLEAGPPEHILPHRPKLGNGFIPEAP